MPAGHRLNYLFQKYVTRGVHLSEAYFQDRLIHLRHHCSAFHSYRGGLAGARVLELGTGWYPVIPVGLFLAGAAEINSVDISRLMDREKVLTTLSLYRDVYRQGATEGLRIEPPRMKQLLHLLDHAGELSLADLLQNLRLRYLIADARQLPVPADSIDLVCSNNTFEHIYPEVLRVILSEFQRVAVPGAVMSHFIDMSDHFAHLDPSITIYHFLRYSEASWKCIDNDIQPQNRWRITHYRALYREKGIPITEELNRPGDLAALRSEPLHPAFRAIPEAELAISHSYLVSVMQ